MSEIIPFTTDRPYAPGKGPGKPVESGHLSLAVLTSEVTRDILVLMGQKLSKSPEAVAAYLLEEQTAKWANAEMAKASQKKS